MVEILLDYALENEWKQECAVLTLDLFCGVLLSQAELRQIGRAIDPIDEFQAIRD
jgi:hypothetical protein